MNDLRKFAFICALSVCLPQAPPAAAPDPQALIGFDPGRLDDAGLESPPDGLRAHDYVARITEAPFE